MYLHMHLLSRITAMSLGLASVAAQAPSLQDVARTAEPSAPTTIFVAREFLTMDPARPRAEAVAVRGGRFLAVGTRAEVERAAGKDAVVDTTFADKVAMPGFVEQHVHPVLAALTMSTKVISIEDWDAIDGFSPAVRDEATYASRLASAIAAHTDRTQPFVTWGYHHYFHGPLSRTRLDELAKDLPVVVWHRSCHEFILNTSALKKCGIDAALVEALTPNQRAQCSLEKGHFFEQGALAVLKNLAPLLATPKLFERGLQFTESYYHRAGITTACEPGGFFSKPMQDAINAVYGDAGTPFRHAFLADGKTFAARNPKDPTALVADTEQVLTWGSGNTFFLGKQVKLLTDGAIYSQLMMMEEGYTDGHKGEWIMDPETFGYAFQAYWDAGYQIHVHNNGDAGLVVLLDNLERAMQRKPRSDHRTVLVHFGFAKAEQVDRWAKLGGIVSGNPYYVTALAGRYKEMGIGPERTADMVPMGDVVRNGMSFSFHSDMPMAPAKPLQLVWAGVSRTTAEGEVNGARHKVTLDQALSAITLQAAFSIRMEKEVGSIEVGKCANLAILAQSPYEVPADRLKDLVVWGTVLEGRVQPAPVQPSTKGAAKEPESPVKEEPVDEQSAYSLPPANPRAERAHALQLAMARRANDAAQCTNPSAWNRALGTVLSRQLAK